MSVLEKDIEQTVVKWAKENNFLALKVKFNENGYPDRLFISPYGHTVFIEFKRPGEEPRPLQSHRIAELIKRGVPATWTCSAVEAINILRTCVDPTSLPDEGDQTLAQSSQRRIVFGPRFGQDLDSVGSPKDFTLKELGLKDTCHSATSADVQRVAGRDREMEQLQLPLVQHPTRDPEGDGPDYGLADTLD